nr:MoaD/ThiS family protein [Dermatophilus congolensis]
MIVAGVVTVRYWAAAAAAAGCDSEVVSAGTVGEVLDAVVVVHPELEKVVGVCTCLVDGVRGDRGRVVGDGSVVELLPPFAGG